MFSIYEDFAIVPNDVAFICKYFYALSNIKELNFEHYFSEQDDTSNYAFINNKTKGPIINEQTPFHDFSEISIPYK